MVRKGLRIFPNAQSLGVMATRAVDAGMSNVLLSADTDRRVVTVFAGNVGAMRTMAGGAFHALMNT